MMIEGLVMGGATTVGFYLIYRKFPVKIKAFLEKYATATEIAVTYATWLIHSGTATGILAAAWSGILVTLYMHKRHNPEKWQWFDKLIDMAKDAIKSIKDGFSEATQDPRPQLKAV